MTKKKDKEFKLILPPGTKPPEIPPDRIVKDRAPLPVRMLVCSDLHFPIQDPYYINALVAFARDWRPDTWVLLGDVYDFFSLSSYDKEPERLPGRLQEEFDSGAEFLKQVCEISARVEYILGNHEGRLERLVKANQGLFGLRALSWNKIAELPEKIKIHPYGSRVKIGTIGFEHGDRLGGKFGVLHAAAWALANRPGQHTIFGHNHRVETSYRTAMSDEGRKTFMAHGLGHGSDVTKQKYAGPSPNWQQGFAAIEFWTVGGRPRFNLHPITLTEGRFSFGGRIYDGRKNQ